jgi:peptide/nickel transport system permease protein
MTTNHSTLARFLHKPVGVAAALWLAVVAVACGAASWIAPYPPEQQDLTHVLSAPSGGHWLGTGVLGRDVLSQLLYGGRVTLGGVLISGAVYLVVGVTLGLIAGYVGGLAEQLVLRLADLVYAVPAIIVLLVVLAIFPNNEPAAMFALGLLGAPGLARIVRSVTRALREELFVRAAQVSGLRTLTIMRRHLLPRLRGTIIVQLSLFGAGAVLLETGLGFLGLGAQGATWGSMIADASQNIGNQPWLLVPSGFVVITFILALGLLGDAVRDVMAEQRGGAVAGGRTQAARPDRTPGEPPQDALLSVRGLTVAFPQGAQEVVVVSDVDLDVRPGEAVGLLGESGCGKSVTALSILGLLRSGGRIVSGSVWFEGADLARADSQALRRVRGGRIGWISQEPITSLDPTFTVGSQVAEAVRAHSDCSRAEARGRARARLGHVRLPDPQAVARSYPHQLSGGMAQRVGIAAALASEPVLLIADEPTTALDVTVQAEILDTLRDLQSRGMALILVTHDWGVLSDVCERAVVMYAGQVVEQATVADLVAHPEHRYTAALLAANPHTAEPGALLPAIEGSVPAPSQWPQGCRFHDRCAFAQADCEAGPITLRRRDASGDLPDDAVAAPRDRCLHPVSLDAVAEGVSR